MKNGFKDSRLLEAFDHIDPRFISEVAEELKIEPEISPEHDKKAARRSIKYVLALAACVMLLSAILPVINYVIGNLGSTPGGNPAGVGSESDSRVIKTGYQVYGSEVYNECIGRLVRYRPATDEYESLCDHDICPEGCHFRSIECLSQIVDGKLYYVYDSVWGTVKDIRAAYLDLSTMKSVDICDISAYSISGRAYVYEGYYYFSRAIGLPSYHGELYRIPLTGGEEELVLEFDSVESLLMVADGEFITVNRYREISDPSTPKDAVIKAYNIETGEERVLWSGVGGENAKRVIEPAFLDGRLYFLTSTDMGYDLISLDLKSGEEKCLKSGVYQYYWLMNDGVYYFPFESRTVDYHSMLSATISGLYSTGAAASLHYCDLDGNGDTVVYENGDIAPCYPSGLVISGGKACGYFCGAFPSLGLERVEVLISIDLETGEIKQLEPSYKAKTVEVTEPENTEEEIEIPEPPGGLNFIEHVGEVPEEFKEIVENNLLGGGYHIGDVIVTYYSEDDRYRVLVKDDKSGNILTSALVGGAREWPSEVFVDSEKNLIIVLRVDTTVGSKPSGHYKIVKIDPSGKTVFEKSMLGVEAGYDYMIENGEGYIFVGTYSVDNGTKRSTTDISVLLLSRDGELKKRERIGGDDYDTLYNVEKNGDGVSIYFYMHTADRNGSYQRVDIDGGLGTPKYTEITKDDLPDYVYFTVNGKPYYEMTDFFTEYKWNKLAGSKVIEYDDIVLLVYSRFTSEYDLIKHGLLAAIPATYYYRETVYEAYTKSGELIWRSAVDSTDYDFLREYYSINE